MSDSVQHECGIAMLRLRKPLSYYQQKYGTPLYGINKMYLLMEKQHNRGQDGAGIASVQFDVTPGHKYVSRLRSIDSQPLKTIFEQILSQFADIQKQNPQQYADTDWLKENADFAGELFLGHLRYGTYGKNSIESCHPFIRANNWKTRHLAMAGNFNLTNVDELFNKLLELGQHPREKADTVTVLEKVGHFVDEENERLFRQFKQEGHSNAKISEMIAEHMDIQRILNRSSKEWDGGYAMAGLLGHGDAFVFRDPNGIRPVFYYLDDEVAVVTSERPVIQTAFNVPFRSIKELKPGHALIIKRNGVVSEQQCRTPLEKRSCTFERIYFSRGSDAEIYQERQNLGRYVTPAVLESVNHDLDNTIFSYIPNTAEVAYYGMVKALEDYASELKAKEIIKLGPGFSEQQLKHILAIHPRVEKVAIKDAKLRTFITDDSHRNDLVSHVYDITYGTVRAGIDSLVMLDDSIVRGTTLKQSIIKILDRLEPKKIVIVSSAPQIRYPDCYGIDMAKIGDFIAFKAAIALLKERNMDSLINDVYEQCKAQLLLKRNEMHNCVKAIYAPFTDKEISAKIAQLITPPETKAAVELVFQPLEGLHKACPNHTGDWYFSGNYPTPGGNKVVNRAYVNFMEGRDERAY